MNILKKVLFAGAVAACVSLFFTACKQEESTPVDNSSGTVDTRPEQKPENPPETPLVQPEQEEEKLLTVPEYSLGVYPYYKDVMTTYHCKVINKDLVVNGEKVIVKDIMKLTVGFTNSGSLPLAYLWSEKPVIQLEMAGVEDLSGYSSQVANNYNVMFLMPGETITYDYLLKPEDPHRVIFRGETAVTFMPIGESRIINNPDYDLNEIFMPIVGAKNYQNYMVHSSSEFQVDIQDCSVKLIQKQPSEVYLDRIRHDYFTVDSSVMDMIRKNGYSFNNVTPVYGLRYSLANLDGAQDFIDDIDANIAIENNLQHSKNQYFALHDGKTVLYVPDINRLTEISHDGGDLYDLNLNNPEMIAVLSHTQLDLEDTVARFVYTDGYINFILLSDGNYEYIKPVKNYPEFGMLKNQLYTPEQVAKNIIANAQKLNSSDNNELTSDIYSKLLKTTSDVIAEYRAGTPEKKNYQAVPEAVELPQTISEEAVGMDVNWESGRSVVSLPIDTKDGRYTMLIIVGNSLETPEIEAVTFIKGETENSEPLPVYDEKRLLESINTMAERYQSTPPNSQYYDALPNGWKFKKITSLDGCKIVIDDTDITRATVAVPLGTKGDAWAHVRVRDINGVCRVVGVRFSKESTQVKEQD